MYFTFYNCSGLTTLDVSSFDTSSVIDMHSMFYNCSGVTTLDLSSFNTSSVVDMAYMFTSCFGLTTLDLSSFNTSSVATMAYMFYNCLGVTDIIGVDTFDIGGLNSTNDLDNFATGVTLPTARYDALLLAWEAQDPFDGMAPNFGSSTYTGGGAVAAARASLISRDSWTITDGGVA
jgi:surface protein